MATFKTSVLLLKTPHIPGKILNTLTLITMLRWNLVHWRTGR